MPDREVSPKAVRRLLKEAGTALPGVWQACGVALLSGLACWFWLIPEIARETRPQPASGTTDRTVATVPREDLDGALSTIAVPGSLLAKLRSRTQDCTVRLAWVTLSRREGTPPKPVRLQSGGYYSPTLVVTSQPVRVAIPYPAPYGIGRGIVTVLGNDSDLTVTLLPPWHVPSTPGGASTVVTWHPDAACAKP